MSMDYTVIFSVRQRFGDGKVESWGEFSPDESAPFVGLKKEYQFSCPDVNNVEQSVLQFQSISVNFYCTIKVNNIEIYGGISPSPVRRQVESDNSSFLVPLWKSNTLLIHSNVLREENILLIDSRGDDMIIDNMVLFYKKNQRGPVIGYHDLLRDT